MGRNDISCFFHNTLHSRTFIQDTMMRTLRHASSRLAGQLLGWPAGRIVQGGNSKQERGARLCHAV